MLADFGRSSFAQAAELGRYPYLGGANLDLSQEQGDGQRLPRQVLARKGVSVGTAYSGRTRWCWLAPYRSGQLGEEDVLI